MASCPFMAIAQAMDEKNSESKQLDRNKMKCPFSGQTLEADSGESVRPRKLSVGGSASFENFDQFEKSEEPKKALSVIGSSNGSLRSVSQHSNQPSHAAPSHATGSHMGSLASGIKASLPGGSR